MKRRSFLQMLGALVAAPLFRPAPAAEATAAPARDYPTYKPMFTDQIPNPAYLTAQWEDTYFFCGPEFKQMAMPVLDSSALLARDVSRSSSSLS